MVQLVDILGPEGAVARPDEISRLAEQLRTIGDTARSVGQRLSALSGASWRGEAADAYRTTIDNALPNELSKISESFGIASDGLGAYVGALDGPNGILPQAEALVRQSNSANETLSHAHQSESAARSTLRSARATQASANDPISRAQADHAVARAETSYANAVTNRESAEAAVNQIQRSAALLREELVVCAARCANSLSDASVAGVRNDVFSSFNRHVVHGLAGEVVDAVGQEIGDAAGAVVKFAESSAGLLFAAGRAAYGLEAFLVDPNSQTLAALGHDTDRFAHAYSDWVDAAEPILIAAGIVAVVAVCIFQPELAPVAFGAVLETETAAGKFLDATKLASDAYLSTRHQATTETLMDDAFALGVDEIPDGSGLDDGLDRLSSSLDKYAETGSEQARGWVTRRIDALVVPDVKALTTTVAGDVAECIEHHLAPAAIQHVKSLLGPSPAPEPAPVVGPFTSICQGPASSMRARLVARGAPVEVAA